MSLVMATDIRLPIGWLFSTLGVILVVYGLSTQGSAIYARSESVNINLWWGLIVLVFGLLLLWLGLSARRRIVRAAATGQPVSGAVL